MNYIIKIEDKKEFIYINIFNSIKEFRDILIEYKERNGLKVILLIYIYIEKFIIIEININKENKKKPLKYKRGVFILLMESIIKKIKEETIIKYKNNLNIKKEKDNEEMGVEDNKRI